MEKTILVYETETFGIVQSLDNEVDKTDAWPGVRQLCWQLFDKNSNVLKTENHFSDKGETDNKFQVLTKFNEDIKSTSSSTQLPI